MNTKIINSPDARLARAALIEAHQLYYYILDQAENLIFYGYYGYYRSNNGK